MLADNNASKMKGGPSFMGSRYKFSVDVSAKHDEVSGSCILVSAHHPNGEIKFVVDCGLYQGCSDSEVKNYTLFNFRPKNVDFVLLTHNHADHTGRIPLLYKEGYFNKVYTTYDTAELLPFALKDTEKIISLNAKKNCKKALYNLNDVDEVIKNLVPCKYEETYYPHPNVKVTFFKNGHLIGAAMILVQISCIGYDDINILFSGDYKESNIFFDVPKLPEWVTELPLHVICEATYGCTDSAETNKPIFINNVAKWLKEGKNTIFIPALSLGRYQEIAYRLKMAQGKVIDEDIPIWFDGNLAIKYTNKYKYSLDIKPEMRDFMPANSNFIQADFREELINSNEKKIIISTSGMGSFGPAQEYIPKLIERSDVGMHFTCFLAPTSMGYNLINSKEKENIVVGSVVKRKRAEILTTGEFSSHAKRDELLRFLAQFKNLRSVLINHGEIPTKTSFAEYCKQNLPECKDIAILGIGYTVRVNCWKIVKSVYEKI